MKTHVRRIKSETMSPDAYAGFLRLLLTPDSRAPRPSADVNAYLAHASRREPLPLQVKRILGQPTGKAA